MANVKDVAEYLIALNTQKCEEGESRLSNLKLQKLVYYAQGFFGAIYNEPLFEEPIEAWMHGPVVPALYHEYKKFGSNPIVNHNGDANFNLSDQEKELLQEVYEVYGQFSAWRLRDMTHTESPWLNHEKTTGVITFEEMKDFFKTRLK